jgi:hypothetical protein
MTERHMMDLPSPVDSIRLLCGVPTEAGLLTCIGCLRALCIKQRAEIASLRERLKGQSVPSSEPERPEESDEG